MIIPFYVTHPLPLLNPHFLRVKAFPHTRAPTKKESSARPWPEDFEEMTALLVETAASCGGKTVSVLEGGYVHLGKGGAG